MSHRRFLVTLLAALGLVPALACGLTDSLTQTAFVAACTSECASASDRALCETYCSCGYEYARDNDRLGDLENAQIVEGQAMPPVIVDLMEQCGSDLWDSNFGRECVRACTEGAVCQERCDCFLRELRGTGTRGESTRFLIENIDLATPTQAGQARLDAAENVCPP